MIVYRLWVAFKCNASYENMHVLSIKIPILISSEILKGGVGRGRGGRGGVGRVAGATSASL